MGLRIPRIITPSKFPDFKLRHYRRYEPLEITGRMMISLIPHRKPCFTFGHRCGILGALLVSCQWAIGLPGIASEIHYTHLIFDMETGIERFGGVSR